MDFSVSVRKDWSVEMRDRCYQAICKFQLASDSIEIRLIRLNVSFFFAFGIIFFSIVHVRETLKKIQFTLNWKCEQFHSFE